MGFFEVEQKYRLKDPKRVRAVLKKIGAKRIASGVEMNEFFDRGRQLRKKRVAMRLRKYGGKGVLTLKGPRLKSMFTKRMEIEAPVDYQSIKTILGLAGFKVVMHYKKERELYRLGKTIVTLDLLKNFGWFLEIEGRPQAIRKVEKRLGLQAKDREERSYLQMLFKWKH